MNSYIAIDLGTSGVKLLLIEDNGHILAERTESYPIYHPHPEWSEQNPEDWWNAVKSGLKKLLDGHDGHSVKGISFAGQMHGLVAMDKDGNVIRPCILWNDGRTEKQTKYLNERVGQEKLSVFTGNIAFAGFTAPKILWLKENEPENFKKISKILLPKDYLAFMLSGEYCSDFSDASGMLLLDVKNKRWSEEMCGICGIYGGQLPKLHESYEAIGNILPALAKEFGLPEDVKIIIGAGDNAAAAIGTGTVGKGKCNISLGTSGTIFLSNDKFTVDGKNALHSFCHADGGWHLMGCILSAASCRKWWLEDILNSTDYEKDELDVASAQTDGLIFLPYLSGERSPHNDVKAKGAFIGLTSTTTRAQMSRAVMEGVAFALRDCLEVANSGGLSVTQATICGGGAKSKVWREITANILNLPVSVPKTEQGPAYGAAILAMVGCGEYEDVSTAINKLVELKAEIKPEKQAAELYDKKYQLFKKLYPLLKDTFSQM
ncbi:MAG: xylulokinase [Clostridia bacterium]|nr:xylulokinase [Clostridia bacterium]